MHLVQPKKQQIFKGTSISFSGNNENQGTLKINLDEDYNIEFIFKHLNTKFTTNKYKDISPEIPFVLGNIGLFRVGQKNIESGHGMY